MKNELELRELRDEELDLVSAGQTQKQDGLVNVAVNDVTVNVAVIALSRGVALRQED